MRFSILLFLVFCLNGSLLSQIEGTLLGTWQDSSLVASAAHNNTYNEIWGLHVNDREIAVLGSTEGTHFIDVTDPSNPEQIQFVKGGSVGISIIHRDYHDINGYLYAVADEGTQSTLQIMDISMLPDSVNVVYDSKEFIRRTHNIFIDTSSARMYACTSNGDNVNHVGLRIFDISDPFQPSVLASLNKIDAFDISGLHDIYVDNNIGYLNAGTRGFAIADFTDLENIEVLSTLESHEYPESGYNHSGWLSEDKKTYFMADETHGTRMKVLDVSNLPTIEVLGFLSSGSGSDNEIPHNQLVHGNYLYVSYYFDGLQVFDISDPRATKRVLFYDTSTIEHQRGLYRGAWGVYPYLPSGNVLVSDMQNGLFVIKNVDDSLTPSSVEDEFDIEWNIYPNPSDGNFIINIGKKDKAESLELSIYNIQGRKIFYQVIEGGSNQLSISEKFDKGIYMIELKNRYQRATRKLVIE